MIKLKLAPFKFPKINLPKLQLPASKRSSKRSSRDIACLCLGEQEIKFALVSQSLPGLPAAKEVSQLSTINIRDVSDEDLAKKVEALLADPKVRTAKFMAIVPAQWAVTRNIEIPSRDPREIREIVNLQASRHTPFSRSEIVIDYLNLGVTKTVYTKLLLLIIPRATIGRYYDLFARLQLDVDKIVFGPEATAQVLSKFLRGEADKAPVSVVRVDLAASEFLVIHKGTLLFVRSIPIGSQHFATDREGNLIPFIDEIKKSITAYESENIDQKPGLFCLTGALQGLENLNQSLGEALNVPVKHILEQEAYPVRLRVPLPQGENASSFLDVISAPVVYEHLTADLTPEEHKAKQSLEQRTREIMKTGVLGMVLLGLVCTIFLSQLVFRKMLIVQIKERYEPIKMETKELDLAYGKIQTIRGHLAMRGKSLECLAEIYRLLPLDVAVLDLKFDESSKFSLKGTSLSRPSIFGFTGSLEESPLFKNVQTKYVTGRKEEGKELSDFEIVASLE